MNDKFISVTVGIPTYNEEGNISNLIQRILQQKETFFKITEIIIISDATDKTNDIIASFKHPKITHIINKIRGGQIVAQNKIFQMASSDIVVLFEADTLPKNNDYILQLIEPMIKDPSLGMVQGNWLPITARNFIEKILQTQFMLYHQACIKENTILPLLCSARGGRAFRSILYKKLQWPAAVPEDVYAYLWCRTHAIKTAFIQKAQMYYRCAQTIRDYYLERQKISSAHLSLTLYFDQKSLAVMYDRPLNIKINIFLRLLFFHPIVFFGYVYIKMYSKFLISKRHFNEMWPTTNSTKILEKI